MKKQNQLQNNCALKWNYVLIIFTVCLFLKGFILKSQNHFNALPGIQWAYANHLTVNPVNGEDWFYNVIETSDGGYLAVGYSGQSTNVSLPPIDQPCAVKFDKFGKIMWEQKYPGNSYEKEAFIQNAFEESSGYVLLGSNGNNAAARMAYLKVDKNTGAPLGTGYHNFQQSDFYSNESSYSIFGSGQIDFFNYPEFAQFTTSSGSIGYIYVGSQSLNSGANTGKSNGGAIVKLNSSGNIDHTFGGGGVNNGLVIVNPGHFTQLRSVCIEYNTSASFDGYNIWVSGTTVNSSGDNDIYIAKYDAHGGLILSQTYNKSNLAAFGYAPTAPVNSCLTIVSQQTKGLTEFGSFIRQAPSGNMVLTVATDWSKDVACSSYGSLGIEFDYEVGLVNISATNGSLNWAKYMGHALGIDFTNPLQVLPNNSG